MVNTAWIADVANDPQAKAEFIQYLNNSRRLLLKLDEILVDKQQALTDWERVPSSYDNGNWSHKQAYNNGRLASINEIRKLLIIKEDHVQ